MTARNPRRRSPRPDPVPLGRVLHELGGRRGWGRRLEGARVHDRWEEIVGVELAAHARPARLVGGVLVVAVTDPTWASQIRYLSHELQTRANEILGAGSVTAVRIRVDRPARE